MKITVKTGGTLDEFMPDEAMEADVDVADGATAQDVIVHLGMPAEDRYLLSLNGTVLNSEERRTRALAAGDQLSVMPPLTGG